MAAKEPCCSTRRGLTFVWSSLPRTWYAADATEWVYLGQGTRRMDPTPLNSRHQSQSDCQFLFPSTSNIGSARHLPFFQMFASLQAQLLEQVRKSLTGAFGLGSGVWGPAKKSLQMVMAEQHSLFATFLRSTNQNRTCCLHPFSYQAPSDKS